MSSSRLATRAAAALPLRRSFSTNPLRLSSSRPAATPSLSSDFEEPRNRIFALNFPYKHTSSEIRALFEEALGPSEPIVDVKVPASKKGRGTGYAFIEFTSEESARKALELDGKVQTGGRTIAISLAKAEPPKVAIAAPLPPRNPNEELRDIYNFKPKPSGAMHYGLIDNWH